MVDEVKRAIDNNDISKLYSCNFYYDSFIHEYILKNKKRIIEDILNLKLWLDDECAIKYYNDLDFIKASIMASNIDIARIFDNPIINSFLLNNMNHIIKFMNNKLYFISDKTPKCLINNNEFVKLCLNNGFLDILDYNNSKYYLENKNNIDNICIKAIENGIIKLNEYSSKRYLNDSRFLIASLNSSNFRVLIFSNNKELDNYLINNYKTFQNKLKGYIISNNYFINYNIKSKALVEIIRNLINKDIKNKKFNFSFLKILSESEFFNLVSYFNDDSIMNTFGKKIYQLYLYFGVEIFKIGYTKINLINNFSITQFEKFIKIFCFDDKIKMENVRNLYFSIINEEFVKEDIFNKNMSLNIKSLIDNNGIIDKEAKNKIEKIKKILGLSYYDTLVSLIDNNLSTNKSFYELIDDVFESYRRASVSLDKKRQEKMGSIIDTICKNAYEREFDLFASSKMDFSDGYPFLVEPSDIYINRVYKDKRLKIIKNKVLNDKKLFKELCDNIYNNYKYLNYNIFIDNINNYLKNGSSMIDELGINVDNYLSRYCREENIDSFYIEYFNLPLTDEYLKAYYNKKSVLDIIINIDFDKLRIVFDNKYDEFIEFFYEKQILYMLDIFNLIPSFYNKKNIISLINNFYLIDKKSIYDVFEFNNKLNKLPSLFSFVNYDLSKYKDIKYYFNICYNSLTKRYLPIPDITKKYKINNHEITVSVGGYDYNDVFDILNLEFDLKKYKDLYNYVNSKEDGFIIKFYDNKLVGVVFGIRYGNCIFLSNLTTIVHKSYITLSLEMFIKSILELSKNDNIRHIYLSGGNEYNKIFNGKLLPVLTDYDGYGTILYDDFTKINNNCLNKYIIKPKYYYGSDAVLRANVIRILDLFKHNEEDNINDYESYNASIAGRSWYKNDDVFVVGSIDNNIINEVKEGSKKI